MFRVGHGGGAVARPSSMLNSVNSITFRPASAPQSPALGPQADLARSLRPSPLRAESSHFSTHARTLNSLQLWPKGSLAMVGVKSEGASRINRVRTEDALILFACKKADLATFDFHEANNCSTHRGRSNRARRSFRPSRSLIALLPFLGVLPASGEHQHQKNDEPASLRDQSCA
jgi:hypothetical protein